MRERSGLHSKLTPCAAHTVCTYSRRGMQWMNAEPGLPVVHCRYTCFLEYGNHCCPLYLVWPDAWPDVPSYGMLPCWYRPCTVRCLRQRLAYRTRVPGRSNLCEEELWQLRSTAWWQTYGNRVAQVWGLVGGARCLTPCARSTLPASHASTGTVTSRLT